MKSLKTKIYLNNTQQTKALQHCGVSRHAWNWALDICEGALEARTKLPSAIDLHKRLVAEVKTEFPWYYGSSKCAPQQALRNLNGAYQRFFKKISGRPNRKKRGKRDSFWLDGAIHIKGNRIKIPHFGWVKCAEALPQVEVKNVTVSRKADQWFISFKVPFTPTHTPKSKGTVGVDLGIKTLATLSDGTVFPNLRPYRKYRAKLRTAQRSLSRKYVKGQKVPSKNYQKQRVKVSRIYMKMGNIRKDSIHKLTSYLSKNHARVTIEDLNIRGMSKNHKLASAILDGGFYEFRRQLGYKCRWYGSELVVADRYYPSSKRCSGCGEVKETLKLNQRVYRCGCGVELDRDHNASLNLKQYPELTREDRGERKRRRVAPQQPVEGLTSQHPSGTGDPMKQEENVKVALCNFV